MIIKWLIGMFIGAALLLTGYTIGLEASKHTLDKAKHVLAETDKKLEDAKTILEEMRKYEQMIMDDDEQ